jgi:hypothetical protein
MATETGTDRDIVISSNVIEEKAEPILRLG